MLKPVSRFFIKYAKEALSMDTSLPCRIKQYQTGTFSVAPDCKRLKNRLKTYGSISLRRALKNANGEQIAFL